MTLYLRFEEMGPHKTPGIIYLDKSVAIRECPIDPSRSVIDTVDGGDVIVNMKIDRILNYLNYEQDV